MSAERASLPGPPANAAGVDANTGFGQQTLDRAFDALGKLEAELDKIDPTTPEGAKKMASFQIRIQRLNQLINAITEMRRTAHDTNMAIIRGMH